MNASRTVVVAGATGYIGRHVARVLHARGYRVRALARDPRRLEPIRDACDEVFIGEATQARTLDGLCADAEVVVSSLGLRTLRSRPTPDAVDLDANLNVLETAQRASVRHFVFVGVLNGEELMELVPILRPRETFVRRLRNSGLRWTVLRPTGAFNDMQEIFGLAKHGWGLVLGDGHHRINPIHPADIAAVAADAITDMTLYDTEFGFGGPDIYTHEELSGLAAQVLGRTIRIAHLPYWPIDSVIAATRLFNRNASGFLRFFRQTLSRDMVGTPLGEHTLRDYYRELAHP
ncbi:SDR family oxidoreductase [Actinopolymorpha alba]|uniref:SDR family oxidoreductase n=1 Tax=Actinopolymorpha alba TaxID=533267 RepID=UPI000377A540|nr:SDR family oxidoreductase [Actinopolymorpha alba]